MCLESYSLFNPDHCGRIAAVLSPEATAPLWSCDTADTMAFVSHFPRVAQGSREPYICRDTKQPVSGFREKGLIQRWALGGQDAIVCFCRVGRHGSISAAAEGDSRSQKAVCYHP